MPGIHSQNVILVEGDADEIVPNAKLATDMHGFVIMVPPGEGGERLLDMLWRITMAYAGKGQHGDKVMLSNWRNPPRPVAKSAEQGSRITGDTGKSVEGERDSAGSVVARKRSNARRAKRPCCL